MSKFQEPRSVTIKYLFDVILQKASDPAGFELLAKIGLAEASGKIAGVGGEDESIWAYCLDGLPEKPYKIQFKGHPAHPLVRARCVDEDVRTRPAELEKLSEITRSEVGDDEVESWEHLCRLP